MEYRLRTNKKNGVAKLYFQLRNKRHGINMSAVCTGIEVDVASWLSERKRAAYLRSDEGLIIQNKLRTLENAIAILLEGDGVTPQDVLTMIAELNTSEAREQDRQKKEREKSSRKNPNKVILTCLANFIADIESGKQQKGVNSDGGLYSANSVRSFKGFEGILSDFLKDTPQLKFDDVTKQKATEFREYILSRNMPGTANKYLRLIHFLFNYAKANGYSQNDAALTWFRSRALKKGEVRAEVYLSEEEIDAFSQMDLATDMEKLNRDMFVFGYLTGQRFSDINGLKEDCFQWHGNDLYLCLTQQKTAKEVVIRLDDKRALEIAKRRNFHFPIVNAPMFNQRIKKMFWKLSDEVLSLKEFAVTTLIKKEVEKEQRFVFLLDKKELGRAEQVELRKLQDLQRIEGGMGKNLYYRDTNGNVKRHKYMLVGTHTARRSFVTNALQMGVSYLGVMRTTGHTTLATVQRYDRTRLIEGANLTADEIAAARAKKRSEGRKTAN